MIVVKVRDRDIKAAPMGPVTSGSVGLPVSWHFSEEWDDLAKVAVFRVGNDGTEITVTVLEDMCLVPDELLVQANAGENLWIGVYGWKGTNANDTIVPEIAMPTIWTYTRIQDGSQPSGIEPPEGTPGWSAQIQNATDEALRVAHGVATDAAEGDFDGISPAVTISSITHGHSVTITDRDHPTGQSFNVMDGDSAYEQAVAGGYEGTEAQFNEELASFKELSEQAADSAEDAAEVAPFYAEYGVTTKAAVVAAINGKRQVYVSGTLGMDYAPLVGTFLYTPLFGEELQTGYRFAIVEGTTQYIYDLADEWSSSTNDLSAPAQAAATSAQAAADASSFFTSTILPNAVNTINSTRDQAVANVNVAKSTAVQNVQAEGATQVSAVQTESTTQQAAIQQKGEDVLDSIPADYTELTEDVDDLKSAFNADLVPTTWTPNITKGSYFKIADGAAASSNKYARTSALWNGYGTRKAIAVNDPTYEFCLALYDETGTTSGTGYQGYIGYSTSLKYIPKTAAKIGVSFRRVDQAALTDEDITAISAALSALAATDTTLSVAGASADAKVTGDRLSALEPKVNGSVVDIDPGTLTSGYVNTNNGDIYSSSFLGVTDYIDIHDFAKIAYLRLRSTSTTATTGMCFYDSSQARIGAIVSLRGQPAVGYDTQLTIADVPEGAYYARFTGYMDATTYGDLVIKGIKPSLPDDICNIARAPQIGDIFSVEYTLPGADTFTDVIGLYDTLVENYPLIMSKNALTNGSFNNYEYVFSTGNYNTKGRRTRDAVIAKPKILITSGTHGDERSAVMSLYYFVKAMCENVYTLNDVINFAEYRIIPVVCPWGYDNNSRTNENGVNINRNFDANWVQTDTGENYSGASAADQAETQVVQNWLTANNDAEVYIDFHNSGFTEEISALLGVPTQAHTAAKMCYLQSVNKIVPYLKNARNLGQDNVFAYTGGNPNDGGTAKAYGGKEGIMSFTFETSNNVENHGKHGAFVNAIGCEMFGATIKGMIKYVLS